MILRHKKIKRLVCIVCINVASIHFIFSALDPLFGVSGIVLGIIGFTDFTNTSVVVQSDGKIAVAGFTTTNNITRLGIARYLTLGTLDTLTFNATAGSQTTLIGSRTEGNSLAIQSDNKYVVAGFASQNQTNVTLVRYTTAGALDATFNSGFVTTSVGTGVSAHSVKMQSDQKIVVGGTTVSGAPQFMCLRYTSTGGLDGTFGSGGKVFTQIGLHASIKQIAIQPTDQKIVAVGYTIDGSTIKIALARYQTNGLLDSTFGSSGIVTTQINERAIAHAVALQADGSIVIAGGTQDSLGVKKFFVARYSPSGLLDSTFNGGTVVTAIQNGAEANAVAIQSDGKIVAGGYSIGDVATQFALARYSTLGVLDATFGTSGFELTTIGGSGSESRVNALAIETGGKIVAAGYSNAAGATLFDFALARYAP